MNIHPDPIRYSGSFYTEGLPEAETDKARGIAHIPQLGLGEEYLANAATGTVGAIRTYHTAAVNMFKDVDITTFIVCSGDNAQEQASELKTLQGGGSILANEIGSLLAITEYSPIDTTSYRKVYRVKVDADTMFTSITTISEVLIAGIDFISEFGYCFFSEHPLALFPGMKWSGGCTCRPVSLYNYTLQLDGIHGDTSRVKAYYRTSQSIESLYYAAAQAAGLIVIPEECTVLHSTNLHTGYTYYTSNGIYDAGYKHTKITDGTVLPANFVIGSNMLQFSTDKITSSIDYIELDTILPVNGLRCPNKVIHLYTGERFRPAYEGDSTALTAYIDYIKKVEDITSTDTTAHTGNAVEHLLNVYSGMFVLVYLDELSLPEKMLIRVKDFLKRELPLGSVLLYFKPKVTI